MASSQHDQGRKLVSETAPEQNGHMFNNEFLSDVQFTFEGSEKKIFAHKYELVTSSTEFAKRFHGEQSGKNLTIHLRNVNEEAFEEFIKFLYTKNCDLTTDNVVFVLCLADEYLVPSLARKCMRFLEAELAPNNILTFLQQAIQLEIKELERKSWELIELKTNDVVASASFTKIDREILEQLLKRESLNIEEVDLFNAVLEWGQAECSRNELEANSKNKRQALGDAIYQIRFTSMTLQEFARFMSNSGLLSAEEMVFFYEKFGGIDSKSDLWNMSKRAKKEIVVRCCRFGGQGGLLYEYESFQHALGVSFSKPVRIHGVHLLGEAKKKYEVDLKIGPKRIKQKFVAHEDSWDDTSSWVGRTRCCHILSGFDVMLNEPVDVEANTVVHFQASIANLNQVITYLGSGGEETVETSDVVVRFSVVPEANSVTTVERGQFHQIIFSVI